VRLSIALGIACVLGVLLGAALMQRLRARRDSRLARARQARGKRGEMRAEALLRAAGYEIVARQERKAYRLLADACEVPVGLAVDFIVSRNGEELVAEVKTGAAASLSHAETRRQLLEYQLASGSARVLLVDPEHELITEVCFPFARAATASRGVRQVDAAIAPCAPGAPGAPGNGEILASPAASLSAPSRLWVWIVALGTLGFLLWLALRAHALQNPPHTRCRETLHAARVCGMPKGDG
jgi:Holliday junction resolvase-like predicted endonuclease